MSRYRTVEQTWGKWPFAAYFEDLQEDADVDFSEAIALMKNRKEERIESGFPVFGDDESFRNGPQKMQHYYTFELSNEDFVYISLKHPVIQKYIKAV